MAEREVYKYYSSDLLYALLMTEPTIHSECDFISKQKTDEIVAFELIHMHEAKMIPLFALITSWLLNEWMGLKKGNVEYDKCD